ncbi:hypothetical protein OPV22_033755 [Ensete ventricosum]|uniref:Sde2 N-terminal ubiquitin domain-containing protein n=1 Tax=Ensete ventricosum TaxID=4639 RepID=A0AAV8Q2W5_ENSVE|nr:hypothetical protein OPV22_033755 [Ensete ventricosum]
MAIYQIFIKLLDGRTQCLQIPSPTLSGETLRRDLVARTRIPLRFLHLVSGSRVIADETVISASTDGLFPSVSLLLRLPGGKGGFGSLLRGAATKAGQKKTNNFDACRDMSGRRLRHVNAEKKLEEWKAEAEERRLEKLAEDFLKKKAKEVKKNSTAAVEKYLEKYREDAEKCMEEVEESVRQSFSLYKESKRKILPLSEPSSKRLKIWLGKKKMEDSDSDTDDSEHEDEDDDSDNVDEKSVVLDDGNCLNQSKVDEDGSASGSFSGADTDESSGGGSAKSNIDELNGDGKVGAPEEVKDVVVSAVEEAPKASEYKLEVENQPESAHKGPELVNKETVIESTNVSSPEELLNFDNFDSAAELEVLGMERLKSLLQKHGLKCGGTLQERASRLFLLKTTPLEKLPKKVLAK